ncbi:MAG: DUF4760 domain-containing protein [Paraglaciecola chathamensis]
MARFKHYDYEQTKMIPLRFADQVQPGTFEYTLNHVVDNELDLNEYDHFCTLYNERLINKSIVKKARKTTIQIAFSIHKPFIMRWREEYDADAWLNLELCANKI